MPATVITVSPRVSVADYDRMVRASLETNGVAQLAASNSDGRQKAHLARVGRHLVAKPDLAVSGGDHLDGFSYVTVYPAGTTRRAGFFGEPVGIDHSDGS